MLKCIVNKSMENKFKKVSLKALISVKNTSTQEKAKSGKEGGSQKQHYCNL